MNYQKVYMNQIHSSSLLGQLAQMWRSQLVCDAYIRTGNVTTKAHRVVLLAACPMLQSMEKASIGSHLEVRLTADIKQEAVNMFLQYLYEGFMLLTEDNCKDVEKVARLLQVDSVIKCCADFFKCLEAKTGNNMFTSSKYKYTSYDMLEFRHVRATDLQKTVQDRLMKRASDSGRPSSPTSKKQRLYRASTPPSEPSMSSYSQRADDTFSMSHSYGSNQQEPWDRVPRPGASATSMSSSMRGQRSQQPSVIDIVEDSIELVHVDPGDGNTHQLTSQKGVAVSVASQIDSGPPNISIVNVTGSGPPHGPSHGPGHSQRQQSGPSYSSPHIPSPHSSRQSGVSSTQSKNTDRSVISLTEPQISQITREISHQLQQEQLTPSASSIRPPQLQLAPGLTSPHDVSSSSQQRQPQFPFTERLQQSATKSFAAGSARQVGPTQMPSLHSGSSSTGSPSTVRPDRSPSLSGRSDSMDQPPSVEANKDSAKQKGEEITGSTDLMADITIIKVETGDEVPSKDHRDSGQPGQSTDTGQLSGDTTGGLDMHVDAPDEGGTSTMQIQRVGDDGTAHEVDSDIEELEATGDWGHDDNDDSSLSNDPNNPLGFRGQPFLSKPETPYGLANQRESAVQQERVYETSGWGNMRAGHHQTTYDGPGINWNKSRERFTFQRNPGRFGALYGFNAKPIQKSIRFERQNVRTRFPRPGLFARPPISDDNIYESRGFDPRHSYHEEAEARKISVKDTEHYTFEKPEKSPSPTENKSKKGPVELKGIDNLPGHRVVPNGSNTGKRCVYCQVHRIRTASGWRVKTNYKCDSCDVALCAGEVCERNCFILHHKEMFGEEILGDKKA